MTTEKAENRPSSRNLNLGNETVPRKKITDKVMKMVRI